MLPNQLRMVIGRLAAFLASLLVASVVVFGLLNLLPGDVAGVILGPNATPESIAAMRDQLGLNRPIWARYLDWLTGLLTGQLGNSALTRQAIGPLIAQKLAVTSWLVSFGMVLALLIALPLGMYQAMRRHRVDGIVLSGLSQLGMAFPVFVVGIALSLLVGVRLRWLPANGYTDPAQSITGWLTHLILPAVTLAMAQSAVLMRYVRSGFIGILQTDYFRTARAIGWRRWPGLLRHGMRNAALELVTVTGLQLAALLVGAIVVESVFVLPGLGQYLLQVVAARDLPVIQTVVMLLVTLVLVINLLVDLAYTLIDPRLRARGGIRERP